MMLPRQTYHPQTVKRNATVLHAAGSWLEPQNFTGMQQQPVYKSHNIATSPTEPQGMIGLPSQGVWNFLRLMRKVQARYLHKFG